MYENGVYGAQTKLMTPPFISFLDVLWNLGVPICPYVLNNVGNSIVSYIKIIKKIKMKRLAHFGILLIVYLSTGRKPYL